MKTSKAFAFPFLTGLALAASLCTAQAAVVVVLPTATVAGKVEFTQDISFTITAAANFGLVIFDEWVTNDGTNHEISLTPGQLSYSLNGVPGSATLGGMIDNFATNALAITANDSYFYFIPIAVAVDDVFTIKAATYTLAAGSLPAGFNPQAQQTFTGDAFLASGGLTRLSANTSVGAVPEPSAEFQGTGKRYRDEALVEAVPNSKGQANGIVMKRS